MLKLENVSKFYYNKGIIATGFTKANLELKLGEFVVITGESGSGKSTLLNVISGLDNYEEGEMYINGKETSHYTEKDFEDYRRKYIANIFQAFNLVNSYTVYQNIELVLLLNGYKKREVKQKILDIIEQVGLTKFKNTKVSKLSGGQKQRVAIARAVVKDTPIIVADEPTGNLDSKSASEVIEILKKVAKDKLVVMVTHNIEQVEKYATRIVKMHDGKIVENNEIKKVTNDVQLKENTHNKITAFNRLRIGIRNTFNIRSKFILLFFVFSFTISALYMEYSAFTLIEKTKLDDSYSLIFQNTSDKRIVMKKSDKTSFSEDDFNKIAGLENIDYIVKNDLFLDKSIVLDKGEEWNAQKNYSISFYGNVNSINNFKDKLDVGRLPENDDEVIIVLNKENVASKHEDEVLNQEFYIDNPEDMLGQSSDLGKLIIVGIKYVENSTDFNTKIYAKDKVFENLRTFTNRSYSTEKILFNNKYVDYQIVPTDKVESGEVLVNDDLKYQFKNNKIKGQSLQIFIHNIYYDDELDLEVTQTFNKNNLKSKTGFTSFEKYQYAIFVNKDDYNNLYNKPTYQASVFVKDEKNIDKTLDDLSNLNIKARKVSDYKIDYATQSKKIIQIIRTVVTIILIIVLFFISYLIIKLILKSRNIYFTTLRMLGANKKDLKRILDIELFLNSTISYCVILIIIYLIKNNIINVEWLTNLANCLSQKEFILMYIIVFIMIRLISKKFSKKIFKDTIIRTYDEEV